MYESKVGFQEFKGSIIDQVAKDKELLESGVAKEITWVFFKSPNTSKVGASDELLKELDNAGIKTMILEVPTEILENAEKKHAQILQSN